MQPPTIPRLLVPPSGRQTLESPFQTELAPTESLFGRWSRFSLLTPRDTRELKAAFGQWSPNTAILVHPRSKGAGYRTTNLATQGPHGQAATLMSLPPGAFEVATLLNLIPAAMEWSIGQATYLRACWQCMQLGYHSALFQHPALVRCPLHSAPLTSRCPACTRLARPTFLSVGLSPFACQACGQLWIRSAPAAYGQSELACLGAMLSQRLRDFPPVGHDQEQRANAHIEHRLFLDQQRLPASDAVRARHAARLCIWPLSNPQTPWKTRSFLLSDWRQDATWRQATSGACTIKAANAALRWLIRACEEHRMDSWRLRFQVGLGLKGQAIDIDASRVAIALHLTLQAFSVATPSPEVPSSPETAYADVCWNGHQPEPRLIHSDFGNSRLVRAAILDYFFWCLQNVADVRWAIDGRYSAPDAPAHCQPVWFVRPWGRSNDLLLRARTTPGLVARLIKRYPPDHVLAVRATLRRVRLEEQRGLKLTWVDWLPPARR